MSIKLEALKSRKLIGQVFLERGLVDERKYREFVKGMLRGKNAMKGEMERKTVYGDENFIKKLSKEYGVAGIIRSKGRPRKDEASKRQT